MKSIVQLSHKENTSAVEEELKNSFLRHLLEQCGVPIETFWKEEETSLSVDQRMKLRNVLALYSIQVLDDRDGTMEAYIENELIAKWHKCTYKLKRDHSQLDPRKQLYLEMEVDCWSVFEDTQENPE